MYSFIPQLQNITETIRRLIIVPQNGYYSKTHASNIALIYRKGTSERRHAIKQMVKNRCVPSRDALYEAINLRENGLMFVEKEWSTKGRRKGYGVVAACDWKNEYFFGENMLALIPVPCSMLGISHGCLGENPKAEIGMLLGAPPKVIDFTEYIDGEHEEDVRLYFSPLQFPTPVDLEEAGKCASYKALKTYIMHASQKAGSPVAARQSECGGYKVFLCTHKHLQKGKQKCKYHFWVKWDMYYYIHHYNHATDENVGCPYHNHSRVFATPCWIFECRYCEVKLCRESDMKQHEKICETNSLIKNDKVIGCHHPYCKEKFLTYSDKEAHEEKCCRKY